MRCGGDTAPGWPPWGARGAPSQSAVGGGATRPAHPSSRALGGRADAPASSPALVTVPSMGYASAPAPTSLQPPQTQQPVFVVQEVSLGTSWCAGPLLGHP